MDSKPNFLHVSSVTPHISPPENGKTDVRAAVLALQPSAPKLSVKEQLTKVTAASSAVDLEVISPQPLKLAKPTISVHWKDGETKTIREPASNIIPPLPTPLVTPPIFAILVEVLQSHMSRGMFRPLRSVVALQIAKNGTTYQKAGVSRFGEYMTLAQRAGIIELGGREASAWVGLQSKWFDAVVAPPAYRS